MVYDHSVYRVDLRKMAPVVMVGENLAWRGEFAGAAGWAATARNIAPKTAGEGLLPSNADGRGRSVASHYVPRV